MKARHSIMGLIPMRGFRRSLGTWKSLSLDYSKADDTRIGLRADRSHTFRSLRKPIAKT
jgi:hypothetical protein